MKKWITVCCLVSLVGAGWAEAAGPPPGGRPPGGGRPPPGGWHGGGGYHGGGGWHGGSGWHGGGWRGGVWIGAPIVIGAPYYPWPYYNYPYYPYPYYRYGPPVVREYVYEQPVQSQAPTVVAPQTPTWYYCRESRAYYPYVSECPGGWDSVPGKPPAGGQP